MIGIISSSIREERLSHRVAIALSNAFHVKNIEAVLIDLKEMNFPLFDERISNLIHPPEALTRLSEILNASDKIVFVTPEYNGTIPASLKNLIDVLDGNEFPDKRIGIVSVSTGSMGGIRAAQQLQQIILALQAHPIPQMLLVREVDKFFDQSGECQNELISNKLQKFIHAVIR